MNQAKNKGKRVIGRPRYPGSVEVRGKGIAEKNAPGFEEEEWMLLAEVTMSRGRGNGRD